MSTPLKAGQRAFARNVYKSRDQSKNLTSVAKNVAKSNKNMKTSVANKDYLQMIKSVSMSGMRSKFAMLSEKTGFYTNSEQSNSQRQARRNDRKDKDQTPKLNFAVSGVTSFLVSLVVGFFMLMDDGG